MFQPVKEGLGAYLQGFYTQIVPTTTPLSEFITRGFPYSVAWAPSRMVDEVEKMIAAWQRNDTTPGATRPANLPAILVAMDQGYTPTSRELTRQLSNPIDVRIPGDTRGRVFGLRTIAGDIRVQIAIAAADEPTARSLAAQFCNYIDAVQNRRFPVSWTFAGVTEEWSAMIENPDVMAIATHTDSADLVLLAIDIVLRTTIPLYDAPAVGQPNDGNGAPGTNDPAGYPVVIDAFITIGIKE